ncbi:acetyltransferase, GNAT family protein [Melissococcus plutonius]|uniref:GNAT family N-acetyltransferase n=1 Tax=Melissococcus plutonius TaxID=33970 RepID=UPI00065E05E1|nr:GNAT family protein [Melissococcus plutonius]AIM24748.1 acetyltransferase, GNAT family protein [Melissococcus plutonius S1]KMT24860.1 acetyltransferase, GNAT family protein [Melissococcus plutonius]KMT26497.1 acetyltransferase, GNAT family protein [Melissococcus plutonius]KMT27747.1 acetyltransferase, GNAT family protein [Melissococcus plutonius]KMT29519.1 acetyltransferase, GNAT family protein [Melissococcus plutonius]
MSEEITIREAIPTNAAQMLTVIKKINAETSYLVMDENIQRLTKEEVADNLAALYSSSNNITLLALNNEKIIGLASVKASSEQRMSHIGEIGISLLSDYWGFGLSSILLEEIIQWAKNTYLIRRLELSVQKRNQRAFHLYKKFGFKIEAEMLRGFQTKDGEFLPVYLMSLLID